MRQQEEEEEGKKAVDVLLCGRRSLSLPFRTALVAVL